MNDGLEVQATHAEAKFSELLAEVEQGRTVRITRDGKVVARVVPEESAHPAGASEAIRRLKALRSEFGKAPLDEVLAYRHEGHRF